MIVESIVSKNGEVYKVKKCQKSGEENLLVNCVDGTCPLFRDFDHKKLIVKCEKI